MLIDELDEALVEETLVIGSRVFASIVLDGVEDVILEVPGDVLEVDIEGTPVLPSEMLAEVDNTCKVEVDESESELEDELVKETLVLDSKVFGSTALVVLDDEALGLVEEALESDSDVEELVEIEVDDVGWGLVDVELEIETAAVGVVSIYTVPGCSSCGWTMLIVVAPPLRVLVPPYGRVTVTNCARLPTTMVPA
ncbi:hypothetical protein CSAL01_03915 [Colletotrichum salicis]|uniref:Uncharacterized protein n=1 Tax=Colletotrichum salicis TaxID=1209931 RepID=A0A135URD1_9PEZI|nr:hypothetical protein CSAL01_03915 [Colletotrichum salicis]